MPNDSTSKYIPMRNGHTKTYSQMFVETLFIITKKWKQPKFSSTQGINKI